MCGWQVTFRLAGFARSVGNLRCTSVVFLEVSKMTTRAKLCFGLDEKSKGLGSKVVSKSVRPVMTVP